MRGCLYLFQTNQMKGLLFTTLFLISLTIFGQETSIKPDAFRSYKSAVGFLGNHKVLGIQAEYKFTKHFGFKAIGAKVLGYENSSEYAYTAIGLITYYLPTSVKYIEPVFVAGGIYTLYHWTILNRRGIIRSGDIHDINVGAGFGINFRFSDRFRTGIHLFLANHYSTSYTRSQVKITGRKILLLPTLTLEYLF